MVNKKFIYLKIFYIILMILVFSFIAETILEKNSQMDISSVERYIRLKERRPNSSEKVGSPSKDLDYSKKIPVFLRTDKNGFIEPSGVYKKSDLEICFLGGSTTECLHIVEDERFPYLVGNLLEEKINKKVNSYNSGVSGNDTSHSINILYNKILFFKPDIVVMMHNANDLSILLHEGSYWNNNSFRSLIVEVDYKSPSILFKVLKKMTFPHLFSRVIGLYNNIQSGISGKSSIIDEFSNVRNKTPEYNVSAFISDYEDNLNLFIDICEYKKITPVLMTMANFLKVNPNNQEKDLLNDAKGLGLSYDEYKVMFDAFNEKIRSISKERNVFLIDLDKEMPKDFDHFVDIIHLDYKGSHLAAEIISRKLSQIVS